MPAFAQSAGGTLTDEQIDILVARHARALGAPRRARRRRAAALRGAAGRRRARGAQAYAAHCAGCHGPTGKGGPQGGSIVDGVVPRRW